MFGLESTLPFAMDWFKAYDTKGYILWFFLTKLTKSQKRAHYLNNMVLEGKEIQPHTTVNEEVGKQKKINAKDRENYDENT